MAFYGFGKNGLNMLLYLEFVFWCPKTAPYEESYISIKVDLPYQLQMDSF